MRIIYKLLIITILLCFAQGNLWAFGMNYSKISLPEADKQWLYWEQTTPVDTFPDKDIKGKPKIIKEKKRSRKVTFETFQENYDKARDFYNRELFLSAAHLFEELYPLSMGTPIADTILFLFADCYYQNRDYEMAAFHFKEYANRYKGKDRAE